MKRGEVEQRPARIRQRDSRSLAWSGSVEVGALMGSNASAPVLAATGDRDLGNASIEPFEAPQGRRRPVRDEGAGACREDDGHDPRLPGRRQSPRSDRRRRRPCRCDQPVHAHGASIGCRRAAAPVALRTCRADGSPARPAPGPGPTCASSGRASRRGSPRTVGATARPTTPPTPLTSLRPNRAPGVDLGRTFVGVTSTSRTCG